MSAHSFVEQEEISRPSAIYDPHGYYATARDQMHPAAPSPSPSPPASTYSHEPTSPKSPPQVHDDAKDAEDQDDDLMFVPSRRRLSARQSTGGFRIQKSTQNAAKNQSSRFIRSASPKVNSNVNFSPPQHPAQRGQHKLTPTVVEPTIGNNRRHSKHSGARDIAWHHSKHREPLKRGPRLELPQNPHTAVEHNSSADGRRRSNNNDDSDSFVEDFSAPVNSRSSVEHPPRSAVHGRRSTTKRVRTNNYISSENPLRLPTLIGPEDQSKTRVERVSKASLEKRGLEEGQEESVLLRGYGANDPENVEIVNMKESGDYSFQEIAEILNEKRLNEGRNPKLTTTGVNGRYNRTAPTLFLSRGLTFVPLADRKRDAVKAKIHGMPIDQQEREAQNNNVEWNHTHDKMLVEAVREYNASKWSIVAETFAAKAGFEAPREQLAKRYHLL